MSVREESVEKVSSCGLDQLGNVDHATLRYIAFPLSSWIMLDKETPKTSWSQLDVETQAWIMSIVVWESKNGEVTHAMYVLCALQLVIRQGEMKRILSVLA